MNNVHVCASRSYDVKIGAGQLNAIGQEVRAVTGGSVLVVTDETVAPLYLAKVYQSLTAAGLGVFTASVPAGERSKCVEYYVNLLNILAAKNLTRTDAVVALAKYLRANLTATGLRVSAVVSADSILQDKAAQSGQDMTVFPKLFDRVCVFATTDNVSTLQSAIAADSSFDAATRFVPFLAQAPESGSYVTTG